jgi:hypothetical protein
MQLQFEKLRLHITRVSAFVVALVFLMHSLARR